MSSNITNKCNTLLAEIKEILHGIPVNTEAENNIITIKFQDMLICGVAVEEDTYKIYNVSSNWKEKTSYFCDPSGEDTWHYYLDTLDECIGEVRRLVMFEAQKDVKRRGIINMGRMAGIDSLKEIFPMINIVDHDKNGKQYSDARWFYPKDIDRNKNVFIELWDHPKSNRTDIVIYRDLLTPEENKRTYENEYRSSNNTKRGCLKLYNMTDLELYNFISDKVKKYCENRHYDYKLN